MVVTSTLTSLSVMLADQAQAYPDGLYTRFLSKGEVDSTWTYAQTWEWATRWAHCLRAQGVRPGDAVALALPNTADFLGAYFGALLAGAIPAPMPPLRKLEAGDRYMATVVGRIRQVQARCLVVPPDQAGLTALAPFANLPQLRIITGADVRQIAPTGVPRIAPDAYTHELALYQFTSGTSGSAKVVQLAHTALIEQCRVILTHLRLVRRVDWAVTWLPLFHDMGLIGFLLVPAYGGGDVTVMQTEDFMARPTLWLKALSDFRASIMGGPPSAYLFTAKFVKESQLDSYDLSRVRIALVGAEMIMPEALRQFADRLRPCGFRDTAFIPTYGLAENGLAVAMTPLDQGARFERIDLEAMQTRHVALSPPGPERPARMVACVGGPMADTEIAIVDGAGQRLPDRHVGEVLVRSRSLMRGYLEQPDAPAAQVLRDGWLWTGDLGYMAEGSLYITGRKKEIMIVGGRNYYPDDLENIARSVAGSVTGSVTGSAMRRERAVAFSHEDAARGTEAIVLLLETALNTDEARQALRRAVREALTQAGYPISDVVLLPPKSIELTSSGKVKRLECKARYLAGAFGHG